MAGDRLRVLLSTPAYWPAVDFGGPIWTMRELADGLTRRGHEVTVVTTALTALDRPPEQRARTVTRTVDGVSVHALATPLRYRWMGLTPTAPLLLRRLPRPDVAHVGGFRDPLGTLVALWCRRAGVPYVLEPLGMLRAKWRKVALKRVLDATLLRPVVEGAAVVVAVSGVERDELVTSGVPRRRIVVRGNGFPEPAAPAPAEPGLRDRLGIPADRPLVLFVGRLAAGKGIPLLLEAARGLAGVHLVLAGPDGGDGTLSAIGGARSGALAGRVHVVPPEAGERPLALYAAADVFVLPSLGESFGMVAAEAAASGLAAVVTESCGIAELVRDRAALVVPYEAGAVRAALERLLHDPELRRRLGDGGRALAREQSWAEVVRRQEQLYRLALA